MGADAELYLFDYRRYRDEVVPALLTLLRTGWAPNWLTELIVDGVFAQEWINDFLPYIRAHPTDVARYCTHLAADLAYEGDEWTRRGWGEETYSPCRSTVCPERSGCPMHSEQSDHGLMEFLNQLFEDAVAARCLGQSRFVGRSQFALTFIPLLTSLGADDSVRDRLASLELRGRVLGYQFGGCDGIHGWLNPAETAELALGLRDLPGHEAFLTDVRTMAATAADAELGLLWGNDITTR